MPYAFVELSAHCRRCGAAIETRLLATEYTCPKCERRLTFGPRTWGWYLDRAAEATTWPLGTTRQFTVQAGGDQFIKQTKSGLVGPFAAELTVGTVTGGTPAVAADRAPSGGITCPQCAAPLDAAAPGKGPCPKCGAKIRVRDSSKASAWAPQFISRSIGEDLGRRFWVWIDETALERERLIEARWKVTGVGCLTSLVMLAALFGVIWWRLEFTAAWQATLILVPVLFVLNTAARLATPLFINRKRKKPRPQT